jgi:1-acyl-sn-glycerol-3-phosphate acyltransferase
MSDLVYPPVIALAKTLFRVLDLRITVEGSQHVPCTGGAVIASNHVSYLDFVFCGLGANESRRLVRFMAKQSIFAHRVGGPLMRGMHHIPVDRDAGLASYKAALEALKAGEVVGVFPEATISQSFTVKDIKSGAPRMAAATGVPLVPLALWGTQRLWTKGRKRDLTQRHIPISIIVGEPLYPARHDKPDTISVELRRRMQALLDQAQQNYPAQPDGPDNRWWQPAHLGGTAPQPEIPRAISPTPAPAAAESPEFM